MQSKEYESKLRYMILTIPEVIGQAPGIKIFGRTLKSFLFATDTSPVSYTHLDVYKRQEYGIAYAPFEESLKEIFSKKEAAAKK